MKNHKTLKVLAKIVFLDHKHFERIFNDFGYMANVEKYQKTDHFNLMHGVIRMVRLGICSHDPPEPKGSSQEQSNR